MREWLPQGLEKGNVDTGGLVLVIDYLDVTFAPLCSRLGNERVRMMGDDARRRGGWLFSAPAKPPAWDSNVITPGATFMLRSADYIRFYAPL
jgi:hypothetical protein